MKTAPCRPTHVTSLPSRTLQVRCAVLEMMQRARVTGGVEIGFVELPNNECALRTFGLSFLPTGKELMICCSSAHAEVAQSILDDILTEAYDDPAASGLLEVGDYDAPEPFTHCSYSISTPENLIEFETDEGAQLWRFFARYATYEPRQLVIAGAPTRSARAASPPSVTPSAATDTASQPAAVVATSVAAVADGPAAAQPAAARPEEEQACVIC